MELNSEAPVVMFEFDQLTTMPWSWMVKYPCYVSVSPVSNQAMEFNCESPVNAMDMNKDMSQVVVAGRQGLLWVSVCIMCVYI